MTRRLAPRGVVRLANDTWTAVAAGDGVIEAGAMVRVVGMEGLTLVVARDDEAGVN